MNSLSIDTLLAFSVAIMRILPLNWIEYYFVFVLINECMCSSKREWNQRHFSRHNVAPRQTRSYLRIKFYLFYEKDISDKYSCNDTSDGSMPNR